MQVESAGTLASLGHGQPRPVLMQDHDFVPTLLLQDSSADQIRFELIPDIRTLDLARPDIVAAELSLARHLARIAVGDRSWVAVPAFVQRGFTHRSWFVREESPYSEFRDLAGKRVGISEWGATGNTWARAAARDGGLGVDDVEWLVGPVQRGGYVNRTDPLPDNARYFAGESLADALSSGEIDALVSPDPPAPYYEERTARRLLSDYQAAERAFFERTRVLPAHHVVGVRRELYAAQPDILMTIHDELARAKDHFSRLRLADGDTSPWLLADLELAMRVMGRDWRPFGLERNAEMIAYLCREMSAQHLISIEVNPTVVFEEFESLAAAQRV
jgi:4,5-dihydroxyphthalate decarboxylase